MIYGRAIKDEARRMREEGEAIKVISKKMGVPVGTLYGWIKDIRLDKVVERTLQTRGSLTQSKNRDLAKAECMREILADPRYRDVEKGINPKEVGERSVVCVLAEFTKAGIVVLLPFGDSQRYDLVVDEGSRFITVQCKTANFKGHYFEFPCCSNNWNTKSRRGYRGEVDIFAVYFRELDKVYIFPVDDCPMSTCYVRFNRCADGTSRFIAERQEFSRDRSLLSYSSGQ